MGKTFYGDIEWKKADGDVGRGRRRMEEEAEREITKEELIKSLNKLNTRKALREK